MRYQEWEPRSLKHTWDSCCCSVEMLEWLLVVTEGQSEVTGRVSLTGEHDHTMLSCQMKYFQRNICSEIFSSTMCYLPALRDLTEQSESLTLCGQQRERERERERATQVLPSEMTRLMETLGQR